MYLITYIKRAYRVFAPRYIYIAINDLISLSRLEFVWIKQSNDQIPKAYFADVMVSHVRCAKLSWWRSHAFQHDAVVGVGPTCSTAAANKSPRPVQLIPVFFSPGNTHFGFQKNLHCNFHFSMLNIMWFFTFSHNTVVTSPFVHLTIYLRTPPWQFTSSSRTVDSARH